MIKRGSIKVDDVTAIDSTAIEFLTISYPFKITIISISILSPLEVPPTANDCLSKLSAFRSVSAVIETINQEARKVSQSPITVNVVLPMFIRMQPRESQLRSVWGLFLTSRNSNRHVRPTLPSRSSCERASNVSTDRSSDLLILIESFKLEINFIRIQIHFDCKVYRRHDDSHP